MISGVILSILASRMESAGEAGKINISGTTYEFVKDFSTANSAVKSACQVQRRSGDVFR